MPIRCEGCCYKNPSILQKLRWSRNFVCVFSPCLDVIVFPVYLNKIKKKIFFQIKILSTIKINLCKITEIESSTKINPIQNFDFGICKNKSMQKLISMKINLVKVHASGL